MRDENVDPSIEQKQHVFRLIVARDTIDLQKTLMHLRWLLLLVCAGATIVSAVADGDPHSARASLHRQAGRPHRAASTIQRLASASRLTVRRPS